MAVGCDHESTILMLKGAVGSLGIVSVYLFHQYTASRDKYDLLQEKVAADARADADTDKDVADALKLLAGSLNRGSGAVTDNPGGNDAC